ncbi:MAG: phosphotransferase [Spirochaetales bacterium]|nr:phosphotransferase [Spirochaetales bacterium]
MMKLSLMKNIVLNTVNRDWDCSLAEILLEDWAHDAEWVKFWRASANFVCFFKFGGRDFVIRFNHENEKNLSELNGEIELLNFLASKKVNVNVPVLSKNGRYIEEKETPYGKFYSVVFNRISGDLVDFDNIDPEGFYSWGKGLGRLHKTFKELPGNRLSRKSQEELFEILIEDFPPKDDVERRMAERTGNWLASLSKNGDNYGMIHYDFELDNLLWNEEGVHVIDFDDAVYSWYVADIAYALRDLFDEGLKVNLDDERFKMFMRGYRDESEIPDDSIRQLSFFYKWHNFISYKRVERAIDLEVADENPDWLNDLIRKLRTEFMDKYYDVFKTELDKS